MTAHLTAQNVTAIVLNYNNPADTVFCIQALYTDTSGLPKIIVVDNASSDDSIPYIRAEWEKLGQKIVVTDGLEHVRAPCILSLSDNLGYASGNNAGIRAALDDPMCQAVWILNNDTLAQPGALEALCRVLNSRPRAAMAGSTLIFAHDRRTVQCAGGYSFCSWTGRTRALHGGKNLERVRALSPDDLAGKLKYISGASLLIRREVITEIGLLPEEYFLYYEDAAYGLRAASAGLDLAWAPESIVFHKEGGSTQASTGNRGEPVRSPLVDYISLRNRVYLVSQAAPWRLPVLLLSFAGVAANRIHRGQWRRLPLLVRALWDGLAGRMGKPRCKSSSYW